MPRDACSSVGEALPIYSKKEEGRGYHEGIALQSTANWAFPPLETGCEKIKDHLASSSQEVRKGREPASASAS